MQHELTGREAARPNSPGRIADWGGKLAAGDKTDRPGAGGHALAPPGRLAGNPDRPVVPRQPAGQKYAMVVSRQLPPYRQSLAGRLLAAREAVMAPIRPTLREAGVTEQQWRVLRVLIDQGSIDVSALASAALLRPPSLTRILRELCSRGLISREVDAEDGRRAIVAITSSGRHLVDLTTHTTLALLDRYAAEFGVERLKSLLNELALLTEAISGPEGIESAD